MLLIIALPQVIDDCTINSKYTLNRVYVVVWDNLNEIALLPRFKRGRSIVHLVCCLLLEQIFFAL